MSRVVELLCSRRVPQVAVLALMSFGFAGCSADMSTRLSQELLLQSLCLAAGSHRLGADRRAVERRELPQYSRPQSASISRRGAAAADRGAAILCRSPVAGVSGGGRGRRFLCAAAPASRSRPPARVAPRSVAAARAAGQGGTTIIVGTSDTLEILAHRYNVSPAAILQANGYKGPRALSPGQQLIIPHPTASRCRGAGAGRAGRASRLPSPRGGAERPCRQPRRHAAQHRAPQPRLGAANSRGPTISIRRAKLKLGMKLVRARREDRGRGARLRSRRPLPPLSRPRSRRRR